MNQGKLWTQIKIFYKIMLTLIAMLTLLMGASMLTEFVFPLLRRRVRPAK